jgi:hypothetical protein
MRSWCGVVVNTRQCHAILPNGKKHAAVGDMASVEIKWFRKSPKTDASLDLGCSQSR